jgi:hypothetical protein
MTEETIFATARAKADPTERAAYLDEACAGDPALRARVEALLHSHEQASDFLNQPAVARATDPEQPFAPSDAGQVSDCDASLDSRIGPYRLLQQIGEGGMGVVWMAEQTAPVRRRVAVKVIKPGMDSARQRSQSRPGTRAGLVLVGPLDDGLDCQTRLHVGTRQPSLAVVRRACVSIATAIRTTLGHLSG